MYQMINEKHIKIAKELRNFGEPNSGDFTGGHTEIGEIPNYNIQGSHDFIANVLTEIQPKK